MFKLHTENVLTWVFCLLVLPLMLAMLPLEEWLSYETGSVLVAVLWLYAVYFLNLRMNARLLRGDGKRISSAVAIMFLMTAVNFLMTIHDVSFPVDEDAADKALQPHQRALWLLYFAVFAYSLAVGMLTEKLKETAAQVKIQRKEEALQEVISERGVKHLQDDEITVTCDYRSISIPVMEIRYIESRNNYACIHLDHQADVVPQITLKALMDMLPEGKFLRVHRSYIVPSYRIEHKTSTKIKLLGEDVIIPVGRAYKGNVSSR